MARKAPVKELSREERPAFLAEVAALAGVDLAQFPELARLAAERCHDAALVGDVVALDSAEYAYTALVYVLNGHTFFGCKAEPDSAGHVLERAVTATPGHVPRWGQAGEFLLEVEGMRVRIRLTSNLLGNHRAADLYAVDLDKPFLSRTGYRSAGLTVTSHLGETVDQAARAMVLDILANEGGPKAIEADDLVRLRKQLAPGWLADALAGVRPDGQLAMFGDVPPAKAPLSNAQRQKALRERRKQQQLKPVMLSEAERNLLDKIREQFDGAPGIGGAAAMQGTLGQAKNFTMFDLGDVDLIAVWKSLSTDFSRVSTALGVLRLRNSQHAELGRAVEVLQARLRAAGLSDRVSNDRESWYWNKCPPRDYRAMDAPEYMERQAQTPTLGDELIMLKRQVEHAESEIERLHQEAKERFEVNLTLTKRLRRAGLSDEWQPQPGERDA